MISNVALICLASSRSSHTKISRCYKTLIEASSAMSWNLAECLSYFKPMRISTRLMLHQFYQVSPQFINWKRLW
uniref:Uncharacterized protein n=1 Tax=Amphimedon queenslandica TaxID=400682 RepID=A0A1X7UAU7_AMPQE